MAYHIHEGDVSWCDECNKDLTVAQQTVIRQSAEQECARHHGENNALPADVEAWILAKKERDGMFVDDADSSGSGSASFPSHVRSAASPPREPSMANIRGSIAKLAEAKKASMAYFRNTRAALKRDAEQMVADCDELTAEFDKMTAIYTEFNAVLNHAG